MASKDKSGRMKIALVNIAKPARGSGDGMTEYAYELYLNFRKKHKVDLVYAIESAKKNNVLGLVYTNLAFRRRIKELAGKDYDIIHIANQEVGFAARILKENRTSAKVVTTVHDLLRFQKGYHKGVLQLIYNRIVMGQISAIPECSDVILFDSELARSEFERIFPRPVKSCVISLGVRKEFLTERAAVRRRRDGKFRVGYIGSLAYHKNVGFILRVAEMLRDPAYEFHIHGSGVQNDELRRYAKEKGLTNVHFHGFLDEEQKISTLDSFDAFMFPTRYEGFGLPILEAQARGLPIIVYAKGMVSDEVRKYCMKADDAAQAARIIAGLHNRGYGMKERARATDYARGFTWKNAANNTLNTYKSILKRE